MIFEKGIPSDKARHLHKMHEVLFEQKRRVSTKVFRICVLSCVKDIKESIIDEKINKSRTE